jgi:hypothetical protein
MVVVAVAAAAAAAVNIVRVFMLISTSTGILQLLIVAVFHFVTAPAVVDALVKSPSRTPHGHGRKTLSRPWQHAPY